MSSPDRSSTDPGAIRCWKCGAPLVEKLPLRREARCACGADLHCCRLCVHFEPRWTRGCREQRAEDPRARDAPNFCDWFKPAPGRGPGAVAEATDGARDALAALFKK